MYLADTWAWLEYFGGSADERLRSILESAEVATSVLSILELADVYERSRRRQEVPARVAFIERRGRLLEVAPSLAQAAARTKWAQRRRGVPMGLADAVIYETARAHGLTVLTGDEGFEGLPGVEYVGRA